MTRRVVITGVGLASPIGNDLDAASDALQTLRHGIAIHPEFGEIEQLETRLAAHVDGVEAGNFDRKKVRSMGRVSLLSAFASDQAVADAGLDADSLTRPELGLAYGSTHGSSSSMEDFCRRVFSNRSLKGLRATSYLKFMSHTTAANLAMYYGVTGRVTTTCSACVSGSQAIGAGFEAVRYGLQDVMLCGGAEELHFTHSGVFDIMYATSTRYNDSPDLSPRPYDAERDGLVVGEGAGTVIVESYERARARGAKIYAEILGYGTNCDGQHITNPCREGMRGAMERALTNAGISTDAVDYINGHGTATEAGDIAESQATAALFGPGVPFSSTKSYTAHTLGACGAIELIFCLAMMRDGFVPPTRNLVTVDPRCGDLDYVRDAPRALRPTTIVSNNFAFGGMNTSLVIRSL